MPSPVTGVAFFILLGCLGLVCTAQDCPRPVPGPHMDLKDSDILLDHFPDGTTVIFACQRGYVSAGGSADITCTDGTWSTLRMTCKKKSCGSFGEVENGQVDYPTGNDYGDKVVITCNPGFLIVGKKDIYCGIEGWMGRAPVCEVVSCHNPKPIQNGAFTPRKDSYEYGEVVQYSCQDGLTLNGSASVSCSEDGTFQPHPPNCARVECKDPDILHADYVQGSRPPHGYRATVTYRCRSGYDMVGSPTVTCGINGKWSPELPQCKRVDPPSPRPPPAKECILPHIKDSVRVDLSVPPFVPNTKVEYKCKDGYDMKGDPVLTCGPDFKWTPDPPMCHGSGLTPLQILGISVGVILVAGAGCAGGAYAFKRNKGESQKPEEAPMNPRNDGEQQLTSVEDGKK